MKWDLYANFDKGRENGNAYALFVKYNALVQLFHDTFKYKYEMKGHMNATTEWMGELLYVNRFFRIKYIQIEVKRCI